MTKKILTKEEVLHLAKLAKLHLSEKEIEKYQKQLRETLDYIENLNEIKIDSVKTGQCPVSTQGTNNIFFEDKISKERILPLSQVLVNAKNKKNNYFTVKKIL